MKVVPSAGVDVTEVWPPWARAISLTMYRPRPTLRLARPASEPRDIGWKICGQHVRRYWRPLVVDGMAKALSSTAETTRTGASGAP